MRNQNLPTQNIINQNTKQVRINKISYTHSNNFDNSNSTNNFNIINGASSTGTISLNSVTSISSPPDIIYFVGQTGNSIVWSVTASAKNTYYVYQNGSQVQTGTPNQSFSITQSVDGLGLGVYNFTAEVVASDGSYLADTVYVRVYNNLTFTKTPGNISISYGSTGNYLEWVAIDNNPDNYAIYRNGTKIAYGGLTSNQTIGQNIDGLNNGVYNFTIIIVDDSSNTNMNTAYVTVSDYPVFTYLLADKVIQNATLNNYLNWTLTDGNPDKYIIYQNGTDVKNGGWTSGQHLFVGVDGLAIGNYNYTIRVNDTDNHITIGKTILIVDERPIFELVPSSTITIDERQNTTLTWKGFDRNPSMYDIYINGKMTQGNNWNNNLIYLNVTDFSFGVYNITINIIDTDGLAFSNTVNLTVLDITPPKLITDLTQTIFSYNQPTIDLSWIFSDNHPFNYSVYIDTILQITSTWIDNITFTFLPRAIKSYNLTIVVDDQSLNDIIKEYAIQIVDTTSPTIVSEPMNNTSFEYLGLSNIISWQIFDSFPNTYSIYKNGSVIQSDNWYNGTPFFLSLNNYKIGQYNITLDAIDKSNNSLIKYYSIGIIPIITNLPNLQLDNQLDNGSTIYGGDIYTITGNWTTKDNNATITLEEITVMKDNKFDYNLTTNSAGLFTITLDHSGLSEGNHTWQLIFTKANYNTQFVTINYTIVWRSINIEVNMNPRLVQGKPYIINLTVTDGSTLNFNGLKLNSVQVQKANEIASVNFNVSINFVMLNSSNLIHNYLVKTNSTGQSQIILDSSTTSKIKNLKSILVSLGPDGHVKFSGYSVPTNSLPKVIPSGLLNWAQMNFNLTPIYTILIIILILSFPTFYLFIKLLGLLVVLSSVSDFDNYQELIKIYSIWIYNKNGFPFYDKQLNKDESMDPTLFAGLSSALGTFLEEFGPKDTKGFRNFEKEGLAVTMHLEELTTLSVISKSYLSGHLRDKVKKIHNEIVTEFEKDISRNYSHLTDIDFNMVDNIFNKNGIPVSFLEELSFDLNSIQSIVNEKKVSLLIRRRLITALSRMDETVDGRKFTLQSFVEYLISLNLNERIAARLAFEIFKFGGFKSI